MHHRIDARPPANSARTRAARCAGFVLALAMALGGPAAVVACDTDADCGGGTCIKREKRASGVCYGARHDEPVAPAMPDFERDPATASPAPVDIPDYVGNRDAIRDRLTPSGIPCMVTQQCPDGLECVLIEFQGTCMTIE